ncbi:sulfatase-like hydrolase/transferase [Polymorphobacter fuscus]|uniref:Sulfatase-like hydrolase/transferase n=2 Tax=Sandarakinorhabdus fusca TaxID=1439888 RepID=A0A7C9KYT7_9SPHN|nr:sulfatase-like hydrolase/transferase [Polymorphobacter fuscus]MQT17348.1 sulfatase-like hydrolase/transferase [Polymorphobacter fuscus]
MAGWMAGPVAPNRPVAWAQGPATAPAGQRPPNIILIIADDLGINDISLTGSGVAGVKTPNIDAIGRQGVVFANGYAGNATCAPSRAALMTGRYATRFGYEFTPTDPNIPKWFPIEQFRVDHMFARNIAHMDSDSVHKPIFDEEAAANSALPGGKGMPASEITIAEQLKSRGYHTIHLGKWHLGEAKGMRPEQQGFDESLGFMIGGMKFLPEGDADVVNSRQDFDPIDKYLWANLPFAVQFNGGPRFAPDRYMTDYLTEAALAGIRANRNRPFFLYLAYNAPHTPLQALKSDYDALPQIKDHRLRVYAAMIRALDRGVGKVLAELKAQRLDDNSIVIFSSDNGGANYIGLPDINRPYRGWKATFFEGGTKVPFMMRWPGTIAAGSRFAPPVSHFDIYATASAAAGAALPAGRVIDGVDLRPYVAGDKVGMPHQTLFWRSGAYRVVRDGDWKLQSLDLPRQDLLYDLKVDPTEKKDVAAANPAKVTELLAKLKAHDAQQMPPAWASLVKAPIAIDRPLGTPSVSGEAYVYWSN